jgi:hypothetical protein
MGSHGGGTAEGQLMLAHSGITERNGCAYPQLHGRG